MPRPATPRTASAGRRSPAHHPCADRVRTGPRPHSPTRTTLLPRRVAGMAIYQVTTVDGDVRRYDVADLSLDRGGVLVLELTDSGTVWLAPSLWQEVRSERDPVAGRANGWSMRSQGSRGP